MKLFLGVITFAIVAVVVNLVLDAGGATAATATQRAQGGV